MRQFFKFLLASFIGSLVAFAIVAIIGVLFLVFSIAGIANSPQKANIGSQGVLFIDLAETIKEQQRSSGIPVLDGSGRVSPGLYDIVRLLNHAASDSSIKGIYITCNDNPNGFATSEELRNALLAFKRSGKFIYAYADVISQRAYYVANVATKIYCNPKGTLEWKGLALQYLFFKETLDKLGVEPQIFYAGKFKSATEPFRTDKMTEPNRLQSSVFLNELYSRFLLETSAARNIDTATLHQYANTLAIHSAADAAQFKLIDAAAYDDEVKDDIRARLHLQSKDPINFISLSRYFNGVSFRQSGSDKIALIYAQGDIVDGKGDRDNIGGETFRNLFREARLNNDIRAIVIRVNSGGGSAMASENMWRELQLARRQKPVILSFGDYAASGGYYMSCGADSIFTQPNTLTGSIGVFSIVPNLQRFFNDKLGVTFDGVKTGPYADMPTAARPLTDAEKVFLQTEVDSIYHTFLTRVANGRHKTVAEVDSIGQGRVWTGTSGIALGLADRTGGVQDAIDCAARMAKLKTYGLREYPEPVSALQAWINNYSKDAQDEAMQKELGEKGMALWKSIKAMKNSLGTAQARMPAFVAVQ